MYSSTASLATRLDGHTLKVKSAELPEWFEAAVMRKIHKADMENEPNDSVDF